MPGPGKVAGMGRSARAGGVVLGTVACLLTLPVSGATTETSAGEAPETTTISGPAAVVDGDRLQIGPVAIRLHGIDAPEATQDCPRASGGEWACGKDATALLDDLAGGQEVVCVARYQDGYGRIVAACAVDGQDVASTIMRAGLAWAYVEYSADDLELEAAARAEGIGAWQAPAQPPDQGQHRPRRRAHLPHAVVPLVRAHEDQRGPR